MNDQALEFEYDEDFWITYAHLPSWSDESISVVFAPEGRDEDPLTEQEIELVEWAVEHEASMAAKLLAAVLDRYPALQERYGYRGDEQVRRMPDLASVEQLKELIDLNYVYVHQVSKAGKPYVGFQFSCRWDEEHGFGVLMQGESVVEIGGADTAFLLWIAEKDSKKA